MAAEELEAGTAGPVRTWLPPLTAAVYVAALGLGGLVQFAAVVLTTPLLGLAGLLGAALVDLATSDERLELRGRLRRFGIDQPLRSVLRALLLVAAMPGVGRPVLIAYLLAVLVQMVATRTVGYARRKVLLESPATPERNLGQHLPGYGLFVGLRKRRLRLMGLAGSVEMLLAVGLWVGLIGPPAAAFTLLAVGVAGLLALTGREVVVARRFLRPAALQAQVQALGAAIVATGARTVLYFSADPDSTYQLNQWVPVINRLERPVLIVLREYVHLEQLLPTHHPIIVARRHGDVEVALAADPRVVLYVGTAGRNIHFLRYGRPKHVFLNHGDSDKISSANPVVKVYDRLFVAGQIGIDRYRAAGIDLPDDRFTIIGRPQLDEVLDGRRRVGEGPVTLLYAPTWEGYFTSADYSSLERSGVELIRGVLEHRPDVRVVFKPHPASGTVRPAAGDSRRRVEALLREAGPPHVVAADQPGLDLLDWFDRCDVLLSDISAVVTDFLATDKPYLVTNPRGLAPEEFRARFPSHDAAYVVAADLADLAAHLDAACGDDPLAADRAAMRRRVLGDLPGGSLAAFERALDDVAAEAERDAARVRNTFAYDP